MLCREWVSASALGLQPVFGSIATFITLFSARRAGGLNAALSPLTVFGTLFIGAARFAVSPARSKLYGGFRAAHCFVFVRGALGVADKLWWFLAPGAAYVALAKAALTGLRLRAGLSRRLAGVRCRACALPASRGAALSAYSRCSSICRSALPVRWPGILPASLGSGRCFCLSAPPLAAAAAVGLSGSSSLSSAHASGLRCHAAL